MNQLEKKKKIKDPLKTSHILKVIFGALHYLLDFAPIIALIAVAAAVGPTLAPISVSCLIGLIILSVFIFIFQCVKHFNFKTLFAVFSLGLICLGTVANIVPFVVAYCSIIVSDELIIEPLYKHYKKKYTSLHETAEKALVEEIAKSRIK